MGREGKVTWDLPMYVRTYIKDVFFFSYWLGSVFDLGCWVAWFGVDTRFGGRAFGLIVGEIYCD